MTEIEALELVSRYFDLDRIIRRKTNKLNTTNSLYDKSLYTRMHMTETGELLVLGFRVEDEVCKYVDTIDSLITGIEMAEKKYKYFSQYLNTLELDQLNYLKARYKDGLTVDVNLDIERKTLDEINEIEEAVNRMYGFAPDVKEIMPGETKELGFDDILDVLGV